MVIAEAIAAELRARYRAGGPLSEVAVAAPGFLNMRLATGFLEQTLDAARAAGDEFGRVQAASSRAINVEFVSANPTGPLTVGNARGAFVGDLLVPGAGGGRQRRHPRVLLQRLRAPGTRARVPAWRPDGQVRSCPRRRIEATMSTRSQRSCRRRCGRGAQAGCADRDGDRRRVGVGDASGRASRPASRISASASTSGRARHRSTPTAGSSERSIGCATAATSSSRTAPRGSGRPISVTTRTASSIARTVSRPTSPRTSAT